MAYPSVVKMFYFCSDTFLLSSSYLTAGGSFAIVRIMKILLLAFEDTVAQLVAYELCKRRRDVAVQLVPSDELAIKQLCESLNVQSYNLVVGMGMYSGPLQGALRFEQVCTDKFRNAGTGVRISMTHLLPKVPGARHAQGIGNSYCNLLSWQFMKHHQNEPKYCFIHIPRTATVAVAADVLGNTLGPHYGLAAPPRLVNHDCLSVWV